MLFISKVFGLSSGAGYVPVLDGIAQEFIDNRIRYTVKNIIRIIISLYSATLTLHSPMQLSFTFYGEIKLMQNTYAIKIIQTK